jgi:arylesterase / paraoxonase
MKKAAGPLLIAFLILLGAISYIGVRAATRGGEFTTLAYRFDGTCQTVGAMPGAEDMALDRASGQLFISSDDRRATLAGTPKRGAIYALPFASLETISARVDRTGGVPAAFHPHGLSLYVGPDGARTLFVVNHPQTPAAGAASTVEIYDVAADGSLTHRRTAALTPGARPNDVLGVGRDAFYVTNETTATRGSAGELMGAILDNDRSGGVWYYDASDGRAVASGFAFANSLALTPDGATIYATDSFGRRVHVFGRNAATGALNERNSIFVGTGVDNLDIEPDGRIWIAAHPKLYTFALGHARASNPTPAPSQVIILEPDASGTGGKGDQVLLTDGSAFSAASVAIRDGGRMVLGSVFEPGVAVCALPAVWKHSQSAPVRPTVR